MDQCSTSYSYTFKSLELFRELKSTVDSIRKKEGGYSEHEAMTLDVIIAGSMSPTIFDKTNDNSWTQNEFRTVWGVQFDHETMLKRLTRKQNFVMGDLGGLVDDTKWHNSGNWWNDDAIKLFRSFYELPSPAVYLDHTGRKVSFTNFDGDREYDFLYGINPKSYFFFN